MSENKPQYHLAIKSALARRILLWIVLSSGFITLCFTGLQIYIDYQDDIKDVQSGFSLIERSYISSVSESVWEFNNKQLNTQLEGLLNLPFVTFIRLESSDSSIQMIKGEEKNSRFLDRVYDLTYSYNETQNKIGTLYVQVSLETIYDKLFKRISYILLTQGIKTFLVSIIILVIFQLLVANHLVRIKDYLENISFDKDSSEDLTLKRKGKNDDELESMCESINKMKAQMAKSFSQIDALNKSLEEKVEDRTKELFKSEEKYRKLVESSNELIYSFDEVGTIIFINNAATKIYKMAPEQIIGRNLKFLTDPNHFETDWQKIQALGLDNNILFFETVHCDKDGNKVNLSTNVTLSVDKNNKRFYTTISSDITDIKAAEEIIEKEKAKSFEAAKLASIGEMASGVAHEINNPLTIIRGNADILRRMLDDLKFENDDDKPLIIKLVQKMEKSIERIINIISALKFFSQESIKSELSEVDIKQIINKTLTLCNEKMMSKGVEIRFNEPTDIFKVNCVPSQISQVIFQLLDNSYDAIKNLKERWIKLELERQDDKVKIIITDSGRSMPPEVASKVFEPFFTTKPVGKGTGLGLSAAKGIVEYHKGQIELNLESPNTQFILIFPEITEAENKVA